MRTIACVVTFGVAAGIVTGGDAKSELAKLQGTWTADKDGKKVEFKIEKNTFAVFLDGKPTYKGAFKIDPSKKPAHMDLTLTEGEKYKGKTSNAIYAVTGDALKWCANEPGKEGRPKDFVDKEGDMRYLNIEYKRGK